MWESVLVVSVSHRSQGKRATSAESPISFRSEINETVVKSWFPRAAWQIDSFGDSRGIASLLPEMGSGGLSFNRLGYDDKINSSGSRKWRKQMPIRHVETQGTEHFEVNVLSVKSSYWRVFSILALLVWMGKVEVNAKKLHRGSVSILMCCHWTIRI